MECRRRVVDWGGGIDDKGNVLFQKPASFDEDGFDATAFADESVEPLFGEESVTTAVRGQLMRAQRPRGEKRRRKGRRPTLQGGRRRKRQLWPRSSATRAQEAQKREQGGRLAGATKGRSGANRANGPRPRRSRARPSVLKGAVEREAKSRRRASARLG